MCSGNCPDEGIASPTSPMSDKKPGFMPKKSQRLSDVMNSRNMPTVRKSVINKSTTYKKNQKR